MHTYDLREDFPCLQCGHCKFFNVKADMLDVQSTCKRLDHKHIKFAKPWFKAYDCGQFGGCICKDFEPSPTCVYLYVHWLSYLDYFKHDPDDSSLIALVLDNDFSVRYFVKKKDFVNNTFLNPDGTLKWVKKMYYKVSRKNSVGYQLVNEYPDGKIINNGGKYENL